MDEHEEQAVWNPPESLSAPSATAAGLPILAILAAVGVAIGAGLALWASSQFFYIYILYNTLIGGALGWALGLAPRKSAFTNKGVLLGLAVVFSVVPYLLMRVGFYVQVSPDMGFVQFFLLVLENDSLFGMEPGLIGNLAILLVEIGITVFAARAKIESALREAKVSSVPEDVLSFVINGLGAGWDTARVRSELGRRGWTQPADQDRALGSGFEVIAAIQAQQQAG